MHRPLYEVSKLDVSVHAQSGGLAGFTRGGEMYRVLERHMLEDRIADVRVQHEVAEGSAAVLSLRGVPGLAARASCSLELVRAASEEVGELQVVLDEGMYRLQHLRALARHLEARVLQRRDLLVQTSRPVVKPALVGVQSGEVDVLCLALGVTLPLALLEADGEGDNCQCGEADGGSVHRVHRATNRAAGEDQVSTCAVCLSSGCGGVSGCSSAAKRIWHRD